MATWSAGWRVSSDAMISGVFDRPCQQRRIRDWVTPSCYCAVPNGGESSALKNILNVPYD